MQMTSYLTGCSNLYILEESRKDPMALCLVSELLNKLNMLGLTKTAHNDEGIKESG